MGRDGVPYGHVGISLGDGRMVHAVQTVRVDHIDGSGYWRSNYLGWAWAPRAWPGRPASKAPAVPSKPDPKQQQKKKKKAKPEKKTDPKPDSETDSKSESRPEKKPKKKKKPSPSVRLSKGGSAQGLAGCASVYCRFLVVEFKHFSGGNHKVKCRASGGDEGGYYTYTRSGSSDGSAVCYYGFPGRKVWVTVDGVRSNKITW